MTIQMIITLAIVIGMIVMILSDKFAFGAPPLIACVLLVLTGCATMSEAFAGFADKNVIMIAGFMAVTAALQKTRMIAKLKSILLNMANKGGFKNYVLLLLIVMLSTSVVNGGTGWYVLILSLVATIPYNKKLPTSKILMPLGFATGNSLIPISMAFTVGLTASLLESSGITGTEIPMWPLSLITFICSITFLAWALIGYRFLPDHPIDGEEVEETKDIESAALPKWKEYCVYTAFAVNVVCMMFLDKLGDPGYAIPGVVTALLFVIGVLDFKEVRANIASPLIFMMAGVIGVAGALANSGFTAMVGEAVAGALGSSVSPFVIVLVFALLTSICSTFTGASFGSLFVFAPIGISACVSMGLNPTALVVAASIAAWTNWFMPIDGLPALIMGMGKYKLTDFWKFTVPLYISRMLIVCAGAVLLFPM